MSASVIRIPFQIFNGPQTRNPTPLCWVFLEKNYYCCGRISCLHYQCQLYQFEVNPHRTSIFLKHLESQLSFNFLQMDIGGINFHLVTNYSSRGSDIVNAEKMTANEDDRNILFVNYAALAWHEMRRAWRGDHSFASERKPREPLRHHSSSFKEELLSSTEPFDEPVPLSKMVGCLVEVWEEDLQD